LEFDDFKAGTKLTKQRTPQFKAADVAAWSGFPNFFPRFPPSPSLSCKHIMVGLVSAFGGKIWIFHTFFLQKNKFNLFQNLKQRPTDVPVRSDGDLSFSFKNISLWGQF